MGLRKWCVLLVRVGTLLTSKFKFKDGLDSQRSSSLNRARTIAPLVLQEHKLPHESFSAGADKTEIKEIRALLGYNERNRKKYAVFPPLFYKGLQVDPS